MNKKVITLILATAGVLSLSSCRKKNPDLSSDVTKYTFPGSGYVGNDYFAITRPLERIAVGEQTTVKTDSYPASFANKGLKFSSSNSQVATVNELGVITGVSKGIADIVVKDSSDVELGKVKVAVAEPSTAAASKAVIDSIKEQYETSEAPTKMIQYEYSYEYYKREGRVAYGNESAEIMAYNSETGYFYVEGPMLTYKTEGGAPEVSDGKWVFYPINSGAKTRILHITPTRKTFTDINTSSYMTNPEIENPYDKIIRDIMNFFFVSGEKIIQNLVDDYYGKSNFSDLTGSSSTKFYSINDNSIYYSYSEAGNTTVEPDDEINYYNIPTDTVCAYTFTEDVLQKGTRVDGVDIAMEMTYKLGEENWSRVFNRRKVFGNDFEETKVKDPDKNGYKQVDSFYDL